MKTKNDNKRKMHGAKNTKKQKTSKELTAVLMEVIQQQDRLHSAILHKISVDWKHPTFCHPPCRMLVRWKVTKKFVPI